MSPLQGNASGASVPLQNTAQLSAQAAENDRFLDILPVGVFVIDSDRRVLSFNRAAAQMLDLEAGKVVGRACDKVMCCDFCGPACAAARAHDEQRVQTGFPADLKPRNGRERHVIIDAVPVDGDRTAVLLRDVTDAERLRRAMKEKWVFHGLVCVSTATKGIVDRIRDVAPFDSTVLVLGESGTGKELVARAIHAESRRSGRPFVAVNCSAYSENLLESELFGHVRGSFTGADRDREGRFELANGGTVFLDEIGEITPKMQVKLLRVLQEREIERVGDNRARPVDIRIIAATNRDLSRDVKEGRFREDLYYRLNVFTVALPPLRDRKEDIPALAEHFLRRLADRTGKNVRAFSQEVLDSFLRHSWPGNVRELENIVESALVRARGETIDSLDLPDTFRDHAVVAVDPLERIRTALQRTGGCVTRAARLLGVHRTTLWRQMREAGIQRDEFLFGG